MKAPLPANEAARLASLRHYAVLDTLPEEAFDDLTMLAAHICQVPMAQVSLVDETRQWFKSKIGLSASETPRDVSFCAHTIPHADEVLEVRDAQADPRFADSPLVTADPHVRFYAGAPLVTPAGHALGALCVMDRAPRRLSVEQLAALRALSRRVVAQLELGRQAKELAAKEQESARLLTIAEKSRYALLGIIEDEKLAGQNLKESEERFRQLAENIHEVFWMADPAMHQLCYVSPAYEKIWGRAYTSRPDSAREWLGAIHPEDRARVLKATTALRTHGAYEAEFRIIRPDQEIRWIHDRGFPVRDTAGEIYRVVGTAEDITERKTLEEQFRQAQKMEAIGTLAGGIAHDFNNVLAAINGYTELSRMTLKENPEVYEYLGSVLQASSRAADLIRQILSFSRQQRPERRPIQLRPVMEESLKLLRATLPATIEFELSFGADAPTVLADATQIHQVLMNLGTNAWHAMKDRPGRLHVKLERWVVDSAQAAAKSRLQSGTYARISVGDTGSGMDQATLRRIFEPFFTTKPVGEGTGLGLAVVHGVMGTHDGAVTVSSRPGEGTVFQLYFPAHLGEVSVSAFAESPVPRGMGERLLFVDDEELLVRLGQKTLFALGYEVEVAMQPGVALALVRSDPQRYSVVLTDQTMPGMTGLNLASELRQVRPNLPIILMTGYGAAIAPDELEAAGVNQLLLKPVSIHSLGTAVHAALAARNPR